MTCARSHPGVEARQLVYAEHLETSALVHTGAGVDVSSKPWLRDHDLDAQERSQTQWLTPYRALPAQVHPMAVQFGLERTGSPPFSPQEWVEIKRGLAF